jgi:hypothetical protein
MRAGLGVLAALVAILVLSAPAAADNGRPTVQKADAERGAQHVLADIQSWRHRQFGFINCDGGKVNRYTWSCAVGWGRKHNCSRGRIRVVGTYPDEQGRGHYNISIGGRGSYSCVGRG